MEEKYTFYVVGVDSHVVKVYDTEKQLKRILDLETTAIVLRYGQVALLDDDQVFWSDIPEVTNK